MNIRKYKNKLLGEYYSIPSNQLKKDNLLTSLYICKYHSSVKLDSDHFKNTLIKWKSELKNGKKLNEDLGKVLKMNIKLNNKPVYSKHRKTYKDVELTMNKEGLYKPVLRNMVTGGATGDRTLGFLPSQNSSQPHSTPKRSVKPVRQQQQTVQTSPLIIKLKMNNDYMLIIDRDYVINTINTQNIEIPQEIPQITNIDAIIKAGYCLFNSNGEVINSQISMTKFYNTDENTVRKIAYALHYSENRPNPQNPIAIQSSSDLSSGGFLNFFKGQPSEAHIEKTDEDMRRNVYFLAINIRKKIYRIVIKFAQHKSYSEAYEKEKANYDGIQKRNQYVKENIDINSDNFYNTSITKHYTGLHGYTNGKELTLHLNHIDNNTKDKITIDLVDTNDSNTEQHYYFALEYDSAFETVHTTMNKIAYDFKTKDAYVESIFQHIVDTHRKAIELYGLYHGDLKQDNVLNHVDDRKTIKIFDLDFGGFICPEEDLKTPYLERKAVEQSVARNLKPFYLYKYKSYDVPHKEYKYIYNFSHMIHAHDIWRMFYSIMNPLTYNKYSNIEKITLWHELNRLYIDRKEKITDRKKKIVYEDSRDQNALDMIIEEYIKPEIFFKN